MRSMPSFRYWPSGGSRWRRPSAVVSRSSLPSAWPYWSSRDLLLLDEPSLGLLPNLVKELGNALKEIQAMGMAVLLVEQNVKMAISLSQRIYVMRTGQIILEETQEEMKRRDTLWDLF